MSLYRKYRPATFDEVIGQNHVTQTLQNALQTNRVTHAYLFAGPRGTGKTTVARLLAQALGCHELDVIEIDAASHRGIDEIRALRDQIHFQPSHSEKKVYILDEVHMLTKEAFNALLKILEEPPIHAHFVLCTTEPHKVPVTIISRTQRFDFRLGDELQLQALIEKTAANEGIQLAPEAVDMIAQYAQGGYRDALSLLDQLVQSLGDTSGLIGVEQTRNVLGLVDTQQVQRLVDAILSRHTDQFQQHIESLANQQINWQYVLSLVLKELRSLLLQKNQMVDEVIPLIQLLTQAAADIRVSPIPQLPLEMAVFTWWRRGENTESRVEASGNQSGLASDKAGQKSSQINAMLEKKNIETKSETTKTTVSVSNPVALEDIAGMWSDVLEAVKMQSHTLEALLKGCEPGEIKGDALHLHFKHAFHKDRISDPVNKKIVGEVIQNITGKNVSIVCVLTEQNSSHRDFHGGNGVAEERQNKIKTDTIRPARLQDPFEQVRKDVGGKVIE